MKIGYSFWGFLFHGVVDTPDGGRSHRLPFLKALTAGGASIVCLQKNRDAEEAGAFTPVAGIAFDSHGHPAIDALICEHRWPIPGRNTEGDRSRGGYTPDLERQQELLTIYGGRVPVIVWDKDMKLDGDIGPASTTVAVAEAGLAPRDGRFRLLFSFDVGLRAGALERLPKYEQRGRLQDVVYIGNQYERDVSFKKYIDGVGGLMGQRPVVFGNWTKYPEQHRENLKAFPNVCFHGRLAYSELSRAYETAFCTVLVAPDRYYAHGQITQRIFEALAHHVIPFVPQEYRHVRGVVLDELVVSSARDVVDRIRSLRSRGDAYIRHLMHAQIASLRSYAPRTQADKAFSILRSMGS